MRKGSGPFVATAPLFYFLKVQPMLAPPSPPLSSSPCEGISQTSGLLSVRLINKAWRAGLREL